MTQGVSVDASRVELLDVRLDDSGLTQALAQLADLESSQTCRVILLTVGEAKPAGSALAENINRVLRTSKKVSIVVLDGEYSAAGVTVAAGADLVVASTRTTLSVDGRSVGFHETWFTDFSLRNLKWLALGAGVLTAPQLMRDGFVNFICVQSELETTAMKVATNISRVPADLLTLKKRSHGTRHRLSDATGR